MISAIPNIQTQAKEFADGQKATKDAASKAAAPAPATP
jgi:hypothetical protein